MVFDSHCNLLPNPSSNTNHTLKGKREHRRPEILSLPAYIVNQEVSEKDYSTCQPSDHQTGSLRLSRRSE